MGRREENKAQKHSAILGAGLRLFLTHGVGATSVEMIVAEADVARGTFYLYFDGKEALVDALVDRFFTPLMGVFDVAEGGLEGAPTPTACMRVYQEMGLSLAQVGVAHRDEVLLVFREMRGASLAGLRARERRLIERITALTRLAMDRGLVRREDPLLCSLLILGGIERLYYEVIAQEMDLGPPALLAARASVLLSRILGMDLARSP
jgi:AcrR family transcriptional regulator